jgi:uncharacterized protein (DUF885 family)
VTTRRAVVTGVAALALLPFPARATSGAFRSALDAVEAALGDPPHAFALLERIDSHGLTRAQQLDLTTARAGVRVELDAMVARPVTATMLLQRKLGDGVDPARAAIRLETEHRRCAGRAQVLFDRLGVPLGETCARFSAMWRDPRYHWPTAEAALADMNVWLARFREAIPTLIGGVPPWCLDVAASPPTPADLSNKHLGYRTLPTPGTPRGGYVPDFARLADRPRFTLPSVVAHELLPGHMIQMPLEVAADPHPLRLRYAPGFVESWGIYAERCVADAGFYAHDPAAELGYLHWRLFRIGRGLVDLAIAIDRLPVADARARLVSWQGQPAYFAPFDADLARIVKEPMSRAAEMLGSLAIEDGARGRIGLRLARYHRMLLEDGRMRSDELARRARTLV